MLIVNFLSNKFKLLYSRSNLASNSIKIDEVNYEIDPNSKTNNGFIGFFDWLRVTEFSIVGIRIYFFEHQPYSYLLRNFSYIKSSVDNKCCELMFKPSTFNPDLSGDQDFSNTYVYRSAANTYLITFDLGHLNEHELISLMGYCEMLDEKDMLSQA